MTSKTDIEHWQLDAQVYPDRVEETHIVTDPVRNIRRKSQKVVWYVEKLLGRGSYGEVRLERSRTDKKVRAVKKIAVDATISEYRKELEALLEFSKPKYKEAAVFIEFTGWFKHGIDVYLTMEYVPLGDLDTNVAAQSGKIPELEAKDITRQILLGLEIMHAESFAHRDLKPQNVLVIHGPPQWWVKLADFGLSKRLTESTAYRTKAGTPSYMAPEILDYVDADALKAGYTNAVDLWAVGCILYRLVIGIVPFPSGKALMKYCDDKSLFPFDVLLRNGIDTMCVKLIEQLLAASPTERPSASQALKDRWIILGSIAGEPPDYLPNLNLEGLRPSGSTVSSMVYDTDNHDGLETHETAPLSRTESSNSGPSRESQLWDAHHLGLSLDHQKKYSAAEHAFRRAAEGREQLLGVDNEDTLASIHLLGTSLYHQKIYSAAEHEFRRAAKGREQLLGVDNEDTLTSIHWLGFSLHEQEKFSAAEQEYQRAAKGRERLLGADNEDTLMSIHWLGFSLHEQEIFSAAEQEFRRAAKGRERLLGVDNEDTLTSIHWLGFSLYAQKKYSVAETEFRRAAKGRERLLGVNNSYTLASIHWLGFSLHEQEKFSAAEQEYQRAAKGRERLLGADNEDTLTSIHWLGFSLYEQKKYSAAEREFRRAAEGRERLLRLDHKHTLRSIHYLGSSLYKQKKYAAAEEEFRRAAEGRERLLGKYHEDTLESIVCLGISGESRKRWWRILRS